MTFNSTQNPMFRNKFAEDIFNQKYRHEGALTWADLSKTLIDDVCRDHLNADEKERLIKYHTDLKFVAGGRYLYYSGRIKKFFNNCFSGSQEFITDKGLKTFEETVGSTVNVLSSKTSGFLPASVQCFGEQDIYEYTFQNFRGKSKKQWSVNATKDHRWILKNGEETTSLDIGNVVGAVGYFGAVDQQAFLHGMIFADGNVYVLKHGFGHQLRLCGAKDRFLALVDQEEVSITYPTFAKGEPVLYINSEVNFKELPTTTAVNYIANFLLGWASLDGHFGKVNQLHSIDKKAIEYFSSNAYLAGYVITGEVIGTDTPTNFGDRKNTLYRVNFSHTKDFPGFKVVNKILLGKQKAYCVVEPIYHEFTLKDGIRTSNCYLLRALEDSREDWADLSKRAETCLATGGGIGIDYSVYRGAGSILHGTGGIASGPISKMRMINEIGREIMQGGSRRSAIYASLNWQHADAKDFLYCKNWQEMPIGKQKKEDGKSYTLWDAKQEDFNFHAPLDMTNISLNYDTKWLMNYWQTGDVGDIFTENVRQALSTSEPGFSFNFFHKENETLRNACCEVTSEDDSDVCNLGSINLSRIESLAEFADVVNLSTKFLLCGTLVADLPYEKVAEIRKKNRRLGLGLMGVHEWLIQRNYGYTVTPELHRWLTIYRDVSRATADTFSAKLDISRPIATCSVAPTGSLGILSSTTTGIEPLLATAYKRRYLKGKSWNYQFVVDGTAQHIISKYGKDPESFETALGLAEKPEQRIKFQADIQDYVDMAISSTINLPPWGSKHNNEDTVKSFTATLASYAHRLRGFTCYADGSRGGQPITPVPYSEAVEKLGTEFEEHIEMADICDITGKGGVCGA